MRMHQGMGEKPLLGLTRQIGADEQAGCEIDHQSNRPPVEADKSTKNLHQQGRACGACPDGSSVEDARFQHDER